MVSIRNEIRQIERGHWPADDNPLKHAPHTQADLVDRHWNRPYTRQEAVFPLPQVAENKFWPSVNRVDDVYGDRHLFCTCAPIDEIGERNNPHPET
jgi:glycine dehydrogenase